MEITMQTAEYMKLLETATELGSIVQRLIGAVVFDMSIKVLSEKLESMEAQLKQAHAENGNLRKLISETEIRGGKIPSVLLPDEIIVAGSGKTMSTENFKRESQKIIGVMRTGKRGSSKYFGVTWRKRDKKWHAQISRGDLYWSGGLFKIEKIAAAVVQDYLGNHTEAARLRKLAERPPADSQQTTADVAKDEIYEVRKKGLIGPTREWLECAACSWEAGEKTMTQCPKCGGLKFVKIVQKLQQAKDHTKPLKAKAAIIGKF